MDIESFFTRSTFAFIKNCVAAQEPFEVRQTVKTSQNKYTVTVHSSVVADDLAHDVWHDHNYLIHFGADYHGKLGIGGHGFATDDYSNFRDWDSFKEWIDKSMKHYAEYDTNPLGQMSLF